jgi:hypothetical protein
VWAIFLVCALCLVVIVIAKDGFVRHDEGHQRVAVPLLVTTIALCSAWMCRRRIDVPASALFLVAAGLFFLTVTGPQELLADATRNFAAIYQLAQNGTRSLDAEYNGALGKIRSAWPLPQVSG